MRFEFIQAERANFPVTVLCRVLEVSCSGFYRWLNAQPSDRETENQRLEIEIKSISSPREPQHLPRRTPEGAGGGLSDAFRIALEYQTLEAIKASLEDEGTQAPAEIDHVERVRLLAQERSGSETIYLLRPFGELREGLDQIGGPAPCVSKERWPTFDDELCPPSPTI